MNDRCIMRAMRVRQLVASVALVLLLTLPGAGAARAGGGPEFELTLLGGAAFRRDLPTEGVSAEFDTGWTAGGMFGIRPTPKTAQILFVTYQFQRSPLQVRVDTRPDVEVPVFVHLVHAGVEADTELRPWLHPVLGVSLGATGYQPDREAAQAQWFFSIGVHGGVKIPLGDHAGLRLQARVLSTAMPGGDDLFCSNTSGTCIRVDDGGILFTGDASAGVYFVF
jgi:hypothetical protein